MRSDNLRLPCVQPLTSSYNFHFPHGCHDQHGRKYHHGRNGYDDHGGHGGHGGRGGHGGHGGHDGHDGHIDILSFHISLLQIVLQVGLAPFHFKSFIW